MYYKIPIILSCPLASLTKFQMTAVILLNLGIKLDKKVVITGLGSKYSYPFIAAGYVTSKIDLRAGDKVTMKDLWHAMLITSSNEAAIVFKRMTCSRGSRLPPRTIYG